jgi:hypothetical protein
MRVIATILIVGVFLAHDGANWLADGSRFTPAAVFYMLHGAWEAVLSALLLAVLTATKASAWRDLGITALAISIIEALQIPACRLAISDIRSVPPGMSLCDRATGLPVHAVLLTLEAAAVFCVMGSWVSKWREI